MNARADEVQRLVDGDARCLKESAAAEVELIVRLRSRKCLIHGGEHLRGAPALQDDAGELGLSATAQRRGSHQQKESGIAHVQECLVVGPWTVSYHPIEKPRGM